VDLAHLGFRHNALSSDHVADAALRQNGINDYALLVVQSRQKNDTMSKAAIYRSVETEKPTLLLDEVGWIVDLKDDRQGILCGGFERLGHAEVCEGEGANITVRRYSTYCPKAFGIIGKLTATLMDRSIGIAMQRKTKNDKVERLGRLDNDDHVKFRRQCLRWAHDNRQALSAITPKAPTGLNDRAFDAWEPSDCRTCRR
jgi:hypothetical protein